MNKVFNLHSTFKSEVHEDGSVMVRGMASTADFDRVGDSISAEAWAKGGLGNFEKNPIILFNHDYNKPIGRATKVTPTADGLHMEAKISKHAECADLIKDGVLGAFSVGFKVKDADYIKETDGLMIKDAELFEVSVVSVPCNQAATFSLAKSFDSEMEYEDFKKTFKSEEQSSSKEIDMSEATQTPEIDLEAFAKKVAEETATKIAMKAAEAKAAEEAEATKVAEAEEAKALEAEKIQASIKSGIETGAEKLLADVEKDFKAAKDSEIDEVIKKYESDLKEKADELEAMRTSKKSFADRGGQSVTNKEIYEAHIVSKILRKDFGTTTLGLEVMQKDADFASAGANTRIDSAVSTQFEEDLRLEQRVTGAFKELAISAGSTVLPVALDPGNAKFLTTGLGSNNAGGQLSDAGDDNYTVDQVVLNAHRMLAGTHISNNTDEQIVVSLLPMITSALARAHARAMDSAILIGAGAGVATGLIGAAAADDGAGLATTATAITTKADGSTGTAIDGSDATDLLGPSQLLALRGQMGKYGMDPAKVAYVIGLDTYYDMMDGTGFTDISEVGSDVATKITGVVGSVFGSPVIATDIIVARPTGAAATTAALAVNVDAFLIPRLKGVSIETDYSVLNQRTDLVASQSWGFHKIYPGTTAGERVAVRLPFA